MIIEIKITGVETTEKKVDIPVVNESIFNEAVYHVQETYCDASLSDAHLRMPYMLLGDVAELIKITTGKEATVDVLAKYVTTNLNK